MQKLTVDELKRLLYDTFCEHLSMKDIENIIMTEEESHLGTAEECPVDVESECSSCPRLPVGKPHELGEEPGSQNKKTSFLSPGTPCGTAGLGSGAGGYLPHFTALRAPSLLQPADPPDVRAKEPDLRLRHRLHHQRHAHRGQPGAAQRHEVGAA